MKGVIDKQRIRQFVERGCGEKMDSEPTLRDAVIGGGLLEAMGWSFDRGEWRSNVGLSLGSKTVHMDYLVGNAESRFVLEAKNPTNNIDRDDDVGQLLSYMKLNESPYGIIYNGRELLAFKLGSNLPFYEWRCGMELDIFEMFSNDNFPHKLEEFIKSQGALASFQNYVKKNTEQIKDQIIDLVAQKSNTSREIVKQYFPFLVSLFSNTVEIQTPLDQVSEPHPLTFSPEVRNKLIIEIFRSELTSLPNGIVLICAAQNGNKPDWGVDFILKHGLWRSVFIKEDKINNIKYVAFYVTKPISSVLYFAEVSKIVDVFDEEFNRAHHLDPPDEKAKGKKAIEFKPGSLRKLKDPIIAASGRGGGIQGTVYSDLKKLISAKNVRDLPIQRGELQ